MSQAGGWSREGSEACPRQGAGAGRGLGRRGATMDSQDADRAEELIVTHREDCLLNSPLFSCISFIYCFWDINNLQPFQQIMALTIII